MSNKVIFSLVLSLLFLAFVGFYYLRKSDKKVIKNNEIVRKNITKKSPKNRKRSISRNITHKIITESDVGFTKDVQKTIIKIDRGAYRTRTISYSDPVNDRVLGDPRWAATTSKAELELIEKAFETPPEDPDIIRLSRQRSIDVIKPIVNKCYDELLLIEPDAKGRIVVEWMARKTGEISAIALGPNVDLRYPSFEKCIISRTRNVTFDTNAEDIFVEYPFAFL